MVQLATNHCIVKAFGAEFCAMHIAVELNEALCYTLLMMRVPISGPSNIHCNNDAIYKNMTVPE